MSSKIILENEDVIISLLKADPSKKLLARVFIRSSYCIDTDDLNDEIMPLFEELYNLLKTYANSISSLDQFVVDFRSIAKSISKLAYAKESKSFNHTELFIIAVCYAMISDWSDTLTYIESVIDCVKSISGRDITEIMKRILQDTLPNSKQITTYFTKIEEAYQELKFLYGHIFKFNEDFESILNTLKRYIPNMTAGEDFIYIEKIIDKIDQMTEDFIKENVKYIKYPEYSKIIKQISAIMYALRIFLEKIIKKDIDYSTIEQLLNMKSNRLDFD